MNGSDKHGAGATAVISARARGSRTATTVVAITGACSFLGRNLIGLLEEDDRIAKIVVLDIARPSTARDKTRFYEIDLTQAAVDSRMSEILHAEGVSTFVHLAFLASPSPAVAWAHELESVGTMHVLNACREQAVRKLVMCSTTMVYGPHATNPNFLTEDHPARGVRASHFVQDKLEAETQVRAFADARQACSVTILRLAPILGPNVNNHVTRWLSRRLVPSVLGFDPLVQFLHEVDAIAALRLAMEREVGGTFNIVGDGVLPISTVIKLAGRLSVPLPFTLLKQIASLLWVAQLVEAPPAFVSMLRYLCVADGARAREVLGFRAAYSSRDAVLDFESALRLREAHLLNESARA